MPYLVNTKKFLAPELPEAPLIVFINSKSGGHAGPQLTEVLYHTLGHAQVRAFDIYKADFIHSGPPNWEERASAEQSLSGYSSFHLSGPLRKGSAHLPEYDRHCVLTSQRSSWVVW